MEGLDQILAAQAAAEIERCDLAGSNCEYPRRIDIFRNTKTEKSIRLAIQEVEDQGADPVLTDAVVLLGQALEMIHDWTDARIVAQKRKSILNSLSVVIEELRSDARLANTVAVLEAELANIDDAFVIRSTLRSSKSTVSLRDSLQAATVDGSDGW